MYNVDGLLRAIDTVMASAENRLTEGELKLLAEIRRGIAENKEQQMIEEHVLWLFNFLLLIKDYVEKMT